jgi:hypothetical protein
MQNFFLNTRAVVVVVTLAAACDDQGSPLVDAEGSNGGHSGSAGVTTGGPGGRADGGETRTDGSVDQDANLLETALNATGMGACFPKCFELLVAACSTEFGEKVVTAMESTETRRCYSGGIRERSFSTTLDGRNFSVTDRTQRDGKTACYSRLGAGDVGQPRVIFKDRNGTTVLTWPDQSSKTMTCASDGRTYQVDHSTPACQAYLAVIESRTYNQGECEWLGSR